ncbi:polysaccharide deacetylase family protein [Paenibacillaceae bacterium WGS1546]|uniref:polysaccharide deacetylase family protein n=1 Tax=Cohnella sp. WGS1546 TaxID=3366810 RepID=UPI00372D1B92
MSLLFRKRPAGMIASMAALLGVVLLAGSFGPIRSFIQTVKPHHNSIITALSERQAEEDRLMNWIVAEAAKQDQPPVNAVIDRVWKAIPGYDGRVVDVQATYLKAKLIGTSPGAGQGFPWVYRTVKPKVALTDLPLHPIYRGNPAKPMVALMINVAWGDEYLGPMLEILREADVKATFFFDGTWLSKHMDVARTIIAQGHEASNHAYTHPAMSRLGAERQREEIGKTEALLKQLGVRNVWFAPPSGDYNATTVKIASEFGLRTVLWTLDTVDWKNPEPASVVSKIGRNVGPGNLILMHPTAASQGALKGMIEAIRAKGYRLGTVSETLSPERLDVRL